MYNLIWISDLTHTCLVTLSFHFFFRSHLLIYKMRLVIFSVIALMWWFDKISPIKPLANCLTHRWYQISVLQEVYLFVTPCTWKSLLYIQIPEAHTRSIELESQVWSTFLTNSFSNSLLRFENNHTKKMLNISAIYIYLREPKSLQWKSWNDLRTIDRSITHCTVDESKQAQQRSWGNVIYTSK